ncbi:MAG: ATP-dependent DNA helicase, partial [Acidimicrobiales bacterium]
TYTLDAVRHVFQAAGYDVVGVAPSALAAHELHADAHIESSTIHRMLGSWSRGYDLPHARTVLVVDEAGMAAIRDLEQVVPQVVAAGGRVILVGDHYQLPEVAAGGGFAALATDPGATVAELRNGHVAAAVSAYRDHDRVVVVADRAATVHAGVERWLDAHREGHIPVLLAGTNETVDALNTAVRRQLLDLGVLGPAIEGSGGSLAIGERLMIRVNDYQAATTTGDRTAVLNGQTGTLTGVCDAGLVARMDDDHTDVILTHDHVAQGGVGYAYASTAHKAQGGTWDLAITVGVDGLYREAGYLVMSRGRASNWLIVTAPELETLDSELDRHDSLIPLLGEEPESVDEELLGRLNVSRRKLLAVTRDPHAEAIQHAATHLDLTTLEGWAAHARAVEEQAGRIVGGDPDRTRDRLTRTDHTARHVAVGQRVKAWDRRNIGTITALDDHNGTAAVTFTAADGRSATRTMRWGDISIVDPRQPAARTLTPTAVATLDQLTTAAQQRLAGWDAHLATYGVQPGDRHVYEHAAHLTVDRAARRLAAAQPDWLTTLLGHRPTDRPAAVQVWDDTVRDLAA